MDQTFEVIVPAEAIPAIEAFAARQPSKYPAGLKDFPQVVLNEVVGRIMDEYDSPEVATLRAQIDVLRAAKSVCMERVAIAPKPVEPLKPVEPEQPPERLEPC